MQTARVHGEPHFNERFLGLAGHYGFLPRVCRPYRDRTKGKDERTPHLVCRCKCRSARHTPPDSARNTCTHLRWPQVRCDIS